MNDEQTVDSQATEFEEKVTDLYARLGLNNAETVSNLQRISQIQQLKHQQPVRSIRTDSRTSSFAFSRK